MRHAPTFWRQDRHSLATTLTPASWLWQMATNLRRAITTSQPTPLPSLCIGNITVGGAGKTPTAIAIAELLLASGEPPVFATKGYGALTPLAGVTKVDTTNHTAAQVGDEALLLAQTAPCYVSHNRLHAAQAALADGATIILYDDGLQNPQLNYDRAVLVIDGAYGLGNGRIMPAGPLREHLATALQRCAAVIIVGEDTQQLALQMKAVPVFTAIAKPYLIGLDLTQRYLAFAGIGRPEKFFTSCREIGLELCATRAFPDHHHYTHDEILSLHNAATQQGAQLITTAKDAVRLEPAWRSQVTILPLRLQFNDPAALLALVR